MAPGSQYAECPAHNPKRSRLFAIGTRYQIISTDKEVLRSPTATRHAKPFSSLSELRALHDYRALKWLKH